MRTASTMSRWQRGALVTRRHSSATRTSRPDPNVVPAGDPRLLTYEGVLPGFDVRVLLPEDEKPWLSWLRTQGIDFADRDAAHLPRGREHGAFRNAPPGLFRRPDADGVPHRRVHPLARRAGRQVVRASELPAPAPALHRSGALQHDVLARRRRRLSPRRDAGGRRGGAPAGRARSHGDRRRAFRRWRRRTWCAASPRPSSARSRPPISA